MKTIIINSEKFGKKELLVDDSDFEFVNQWRWHLKKDHNTFYAGRNFWINKNGIKKCKSVLLHRILLGLTDPNIKTDHKDHNGLNNQRNNIRPCSLNQNLFNKKSKIGASSKYLGVSFHKNSGKWRSYIGHNKQKIRIGEFMDEKEAALAYNKKAIELHGEFANLNQI